MIFFVILSIAMMGAMSVYSRHVMGGRVTEQRRIATIAAEEKLDEIRSAIQDAVQAGVGEPLTHVYFHAAPTDNQFYGPTPPGTGNSRPCCFNVSGLTAVPGISIGTVTIINDETPDEAQFGLAFNGSGAPPLFGIDINGNRRYTDNAGVSPFPLDMNGNGVSTDNIVVDRFSMLPVVVTIQWMGPYGRERMDMFSILTADRQ